MSKRIFLDNAATTPIDPLVLEAMMPYFTEYYGNPSSIHAHGRKVKAGLELARKTVAGILNTSPGEIFFTSGGTEADNTAICQTIETYGIKHVISSPLEHHAVLHTLENLEKDAKIKLSLLKCDENGVLDMQQLENLLIENPHTLVSLMHGNNEIGNLLDLEFVSNLCKKNNAYFHSDTVQTMGHYNFDLQKIQADFIVGSAHKFHGPKGVGFLYINAASKIKPLINGGSQERNMRGGTENLYGIIGLAKALEIAVKDVESHENYIKSLKKNMIGQLTAKIAGVKFNGMSANVNDSLYTVLNVSFPPHPDNEMLLFNLDIEGISCSGGSACSSGTNLGSHVLNQLNINPDRANVRFSFSKYTTQGEIDKTVAVLEKLFN